MGSMISHRIDYNRVGVWEASGTYPTKINVTQVPPLDSLDSDSVARRATEQSQSRQKRIVLEHEEIGVQDIETTTSLASPSGYIKAGSLEGQFIQDWRKTRSLANNDSRTSIKWNWMRKRSQKHFRKTQSIIRCPKHRDGNFSSIFFIRLYFSRIAWVTITRNCFDFSCRRAKS